ncbi:MAG: hypothetical protein J7501_05285 [Bdellovibrio sp.]|nr:hypothetical protein [Bdellovibrio sp.]
MRNTTLVLAILLSSHGAYAAPKTAEKLLEEIKVSRESVSKSDFEKIVHELKKVNSSLNETLNDYKKTDPKSESPALEKVLYVVFSMEPAVDLATSKKPTKLACDKAKHKVELEDKGSKPEDTPLSPEAQESLRWIEILCK